MKPNEFAKRVEVTGIITDELDRPIGRIILKENFVPGCLVKATLIRLPTALVPQPLARVLYLDGNAYRLPPSVPSVKITRGSLDTTINNVVLEPVNGGK